MQLGFLIKNYFNDKLINLENINFYRNSTYLISSSIISSLLGFLFWTLAANFYPVESVGIASTMISTAGLLATISLLGLNYGIIRFIPRSVKEKNNTIVFSFIFAISIAVVACIIFAEILNVIPQKLSFILSSREIFFLFFFLTIATVMNELIYSTLVALMKMDYAFLYNLTFSSARLIPLILLIHICTNLGVFLSWSISLLFTNIIGMVLIFHKNLSITFRNISLNFGLLKEMINYSFINYLINLIWSAPTFIFPIIIFNFQDAENSAYFYISWSICNFLFIISHATSYSLLAEGSHRNEKLMNQMRTALKFVMFIIIPGIVFILLLGNKILIIYGDQYYENSKNILYILAISSIPLSINQVYFSIKRIENKMKAMMLISILSLVVIVILSLYLLPIFGTIGCAAAWLIGRSIVLPIIFIDLKNNYSNR